jgi:hypothetical protein
MLDSDIAPSSEDSSRMVDRADVFGEQYVEWPPLVTGPEREVSPFRGVVIKGARAEGPP